MKEEEYLLNQVVIYKKMISANNVFERDYHQYFKTLKIILHVQWKIKCWQNLVLYYIYFLCLYRSN